MLHHLTEVRSSEAVCRVDNRNGNKLALKVIDLDELCDSIKLLNPIRFMP